MEVKDQLKMRMDQLGVTVNELAKRCEVSSQSVRFWLSGRSFPGKRHAAMVEKALSFKLDYTEGSSTSAPTMGAMLQKVDVELFLTISKLPPPIKVLLAQLAEVLASAPPNRAIQTFADRREQEQIEPFSTKGQGSHVKRSTHRTTRRKTA